MNEILKKIYNFFKILKINLKKIKLNKEKEKIFRELGFLIYEFYDIDRNFIEDDEVKDLILKLKDIEIELQELDNIIDEIRLSSIDNIENETEDISNELLLKEESNDESNRKGS